MEPTPQEKLHKFLRERGLYTKDYSAFEQQFSTPEKRQKLHGFMVENKVYTKSVNDFNSQFFAGSVEKKNPVGNASKPGSGAQPIAPAATPQSNEPFDPASLLAPKEVPRYIAAPKTQWGTTPGIEQPDAATSLGIEQKPSKGVAEPEFIKKVDSRIALSNVRDSRKGDYQSDAVEIMERSLSEKDKAELADKSLIEENFYDTDVTAKQYQSQLSALQKDQSALSKGLDGIDLEISEAVGDNAFDSYEKNIEAYTALKEKYDSASKSSNPQSANQYVDRLNDLQSEIEKFQQHPLVQERNQMVKAMQKNLSRFTDMEKDERYKGVRSLETDRKAIQGQVDEQDFMSDFSGIVLRSVGNIAAGIGRTAKNVNEMVHGEDAEPTPVSNFLIDLGDGANFLFPSPSQYSRGLITDTAKWKGYEVDFKGGEVQAVRKDGKSVPMQLTDEQISEIKAQPKSKQMNWSVAPYQAANVIVDMGVMLAGADKITKGLTAMKVGEKAAARTGVALSTAGQMSNGMYEQGLELFDGDKKKAAEFSFFGSLAVGAVQNVFGLEQRLLTGRALNTTSLAAAVGKMTPKQMGVEAAKMIAKEALGEGFEEGMIEPLVTAMSQYAIGGKTDLDATEMVSNGAMGFMVGTLFAGGNVNLNEMQKSSLYNASKDPVAFGNALRAAVEKGEIAGDEEFVSQQVSRVSRIGEELLRLSPDLNQEQILDATAVIDEKIKAEARLKTAKGNEALEQRYQAEVDVLNGHLNEMVTPPTPEVAEKISENQAEEEGTTSKPEGTVSSGTADKEGEVLPVEPVSEPVAPISEPTQPAYEPVTAFEVGKTYFDEANNRSYTYVGEDANGAMLFDKLPRDKKEVLFNTRIDANPGSPFIKGLSQPTTLTVQPPMQETQPSSLIVDNTKSLLESTDVNLLTKEYERQEKEIEEKSKTWREDGKIKDSKVAEYRKMRDEQQKILDRINDLTFVDKSTTAFEKTLSEEERVRYSEMDEIGHRMVAMNHKDGYKPYKVTEKEKKRYFGLRKEYQVKFDKWASELKPKVQQSTEPTTTQPVESPVLQQAVPPPPVEPSQSALSGGATMKTVVGERAYLGDVREEVKAYLKENDLTRDVENQEKASNAAVKMVKDLGVDKAVEAVKMREVEGGVASAVLFESMKSLDDQIAVSSDPAEINYLAKKMADILSMTDDMGVTAGRFTAMFARKYMDSDIGWNANAKKSEYVEKFGSISPEVEARFIELEAELKEVSKRLAEAEKRAAEAADAATIETIKAEAEKEKPNKASVAAAGKEMAKKIRKGKLSRPGTFSAASPASLVWDTAIEIAATAVEAGTALAEAVQKGLAHIKASDWYKGLSRDKQDAAEQEYKDFMQEQEDSVGKLKIPKSLIRDLVAGGIDNVPDLVDAVRNELGLEESDREIRDAITDYGKTINMTKDDLSVEVRRLRRVGKLISQLEDVANKIRPLRSGLQRDKLTAEERSLQKQLREEMKGLPMDEETLASELKTALDAKKSRLRNRIEDLNNAIESNQKIVKTSKTVEDDAEAQDLMAERDRLQRVYESVFSEKPIPLTDGEKKIAALERQLEKLVNGEATIEKAPATYTQEEQERIDQLKEEIRIARVDAGLVKTDEQIKLDRLDTAIAETERLIAENELEFKKKKDPLLTPVIEAKAELLKASKKELQSLREQAGILEARRLEQTKKRTKKSIADLEKRLAEKDFAKKGRKPLLEDTELIRLRGEKLRVKEKYDKAFYEAEIKNQSGVDRAKDNLRKLWGLARPLVATGELSHMAIQGGMLSINDPRAAAKALKTSMRLMFSRKAHDEFIRSIKSQDWYPLAKQSGLSLTEAHAEQKAREEANAGEMVDIIWNNILGAPFMLGGEKAHEVWKSLNPFNAIERSAVGYLDTMRIEAFLDQLNGPLKGKNFSENKEDFKSVADVINTLSSRASLGKLETISAPLANTIFSPRNWASQIKLFSPYFAIYYKNQTPTGRKLLLRAMTKFIAANTALMGLAALGINNDDDDETGVEFDPRSSDFMKMKFGNRRADMWGGKLTYVILTCRMIMDVFYRANMTTSWFPNISDGGFKNKKGEVTPLGIPYKSSKQSELLLASAINKLAPQAAYVYKYLDAVVTPEGMEDGFGNPYSLGSQLDEINRPMFWGTIADLKAEGVDVVGTIMMFSAFIGANVSVYGKEKVLTEEEKAKIAEDKRKWKEKLRERKKDD